MMKSWDWYAGWRAAKSAALKPAKRAAGAAGAAPAAVKSGRRTSGRKYMNMKKTFLNSAALLVWLWSAAAAAAPAVPAADCGAGSPLFRRVCEAALAFSDRATLPPAMMLTLRNRALPGMMIDQREIFGRMAELTEAADYDIAIQSFSFDPASDGPKTLFKALKALERRRRAQGAREPVTVRLLLNTSNSGFNGAPANKDQHVVAAALQDLKLDPALVRCELSVHTGVATDSIHSKSMVFDGRRALMTGANLNQWDNFDWGEHDAGVVLEGEVARSLLAEFDDAWAKSRSWSLEFCGRTPYPLRPLPEGECARDNKAPPAHVLPPPAAEGGTPMLVVGRRWSLSLAQDDIFNPQDQAILAALRGARRLVRVRTPNLNVKEVKNALVHGIIGNPELTVQIVLAKNYEDTGERFDGGTNQETAEELYSRLRAAGVADPCRRLQLRWWSSAMDGVTPVEGNLSRENGVNRTSHVKYSSYDGQVVIVGSANLDNQSFSRSREVNVVIDSAEAAAAWDAVLFGREFDGAVPADPACRQAGPGR